MRTLIATLLATALLVPAAQAASFTDPGAQVFTLGGNGLTTGPTAATGPATATSLRPQAVGTLPDGSVLLLTESDTTATIRRIDPQARLHVVGTVRLNGRAVLVDQARFRPDGRLEARDLDGGKLLRITPTGVATVVDVKPDGEIAPQADGSTLVTTGNAVARVSAGGTVTKLFAAAAGQGTVITVAQLTDGTIAYGRFSSATLYLHHPDGSTTTIGAPAPYTDSVTLALPDGGLLLPATGGGIAIVHPGAKEIDLGATGSADLGDGAAPNGTHLEPQGVALAADGTLIAAETGGVRVIVPPGVAAPVATLTAAGLGGFGATGTVTLSSRFAGTGRLDVLQAGKVVATASAPVAAGDGTITLPAKPATGTFTLRLTVTSTDGATVAVSTRDVVTITALSLKAATKAAKSTEGGDGDEQSYSGTRIGRSQRISPTRVDFQNIAYDNEFDEHDKLVSHTSHCIGRVSVRLEGGAIVLHFLKGGCALPTARQR